MQDDVSLNFGERFVISNIGPASLFPRMKGAGDI